MPPASTPNSWAEWDPYGPALKIYIGQGPHECMYRVAESLLRHYSGYFNTLCTSPFLFDFAWGNIRLPGDDPQIFSFILQYLHTRSFFPPGDASAPWILTFDKLIDMYSFATRRNMPLIKNIAVDVFVEKVKNERVLPDRWSIEYLWQSTEEGAALRRCLVDLVRAMWIPHHKKHAGLWEDLAGGRSEHCERLVWVIDELEREGKNVRVNAQMMRMVQGCEYHEHEEGEYCEGSEEARLDPGDPPHFVRAETYGSPERIANEEKARGWRGVSMDDDDVFR